jgi:signal transduction histidine kinase
MMKEGFLIADARAHVVFASAPFAAMMGCDAEALRGRALFDFFGAGHRDEIAAGFHAAKPAERFACAAMLEADDGRAMPVRVELKRMPAAGATAMGCFVVVTETSGEMEFSQALQRSTCELQRVSCQVLTAQESERQRIAADLHDGLGQLLGAVKFGLESVLGSADAGAWAESRRTLEIATSTVKEALEEVRRLAMNLRPSTLDDLGLLATLSWFVREFQTVYRTIAVESEFSVAEAEVPDALKVAMFRIVQESMSNIAKHSRATRVKVRLENAARGIRLSIEDNGVGFSPEEVASRQGVQKSHGHVSSRDRVEWSGGAFAIRAAPGQGVRVEAVWPTEKPGFAAQTRGEDHGATLADHDRRGPHASQDGLAIPPVAGSGA